MESTRYKREAMRAVLKRMQSEVEKRGSAFVALVIPSAEEVHPLRGGDPVTPSLIAMPGYAPENRCGFYTGILDELGIFSLDLFRCFSEKPTGELAEDRSPYYFPNYDDHWNVRGQALAAKVFSEFLRSEEGLLKREE